MATSRQRLQLIGFSWHGTVNVDRPSQPKDAPFDVVVALNPLGEAFVKACTAS